MKKFTITLCSFLLVCYSCQKSESNIGSEGNDTTDTEIYFPPAGSDEWETIAMPELGWNENELDNLYSYLEEKNTHAFIVLKNGKIVIEKYFGNYNASGFWYWASAGKTLTSTVTGIAQDEGLLNINDRVSDYLGTGWTSAPTAKENLITCRHLLTMTSGLDDSLGDDVSPTNLQYVADAGTRWAYHNVYVKLQDVVANAAGQTWPQYFNSKLRNRLGMNGQWIDNDGLSVYWSNARSMARFGLMMYAGGVWEDSRIVPESYLTEASNTSQTINLAYGYLWWLNGKDSYHLPQTQFQFSGTLIPHAPNDMYCALGKNDQKIYIVPSKQLVIIRMGEAADDANFALSDFDDVLWSKINNVIE